MKILLYITGHRHVKEYDYFNTFLQKLKVLNTVCDIFIHCNYSNISSDIINYYQKFTQLNKQLLITTLNAGFSMGGVEALNSGFEMGIFKNYDYVIHLHPDVFITDDSYLMDIIINNLNNDIVFFITKSFPDYRFFSFDFFIFKPKLLKENIFIDELYTYKECPEFYLHDMIHKYNIKFTFINRFNNDLWSPRRIDDNLKLWHEHDLTLIENYLK